MAEELDLNQQPETQSKRVPVSNEKLKALQIAMEKIEKSHGKGAIMKMGDDNVEDVEVIPTGSISLDYALGVGGYLDVGIYDTMKDLFVNFIGAVVFSVVGFFYVKERGKGRFARRFIPSVQDLNGNGIPDELEEDMTETDS